MLFARRLIAHRRVALLLCAATLLLKLLVPTGYMVGSDHGRVTISLCSGVASPAMLAEMAALQGAMPDHAPKDHGKAEQPCAFAGLSAAALDSVDPILLAIAIAFVVALRQFTTAPPAPAQPTYLRPPLRGPPLPA